MGIIVNGVTSKGADFNAGYAQIPQIGSIALNNTVVKQQLYLTNPNSASLGTGTSNYTAECYFKYDLAQSSKTVFGKYANSPNNEYRFDFDSPGNIAWTTINTGGGNGNYISFTAPSTGSWHHFAAVNNGGTVTVYVDGFTKGSGTQTGTIRTNTSAPFVVGNTAATGIDRYFTGSVTNIRITPGVAVYTASFTPSKFELTATQNANVNGIPSLAITGSSTQLLLNTNSSVYLVGRDRSVNNYTLLNTGSIQSNSDSPFIPINGNLKFGAQQSIQNSNAAAILPQASTTFTIESWVFATATPTGTAPIVGDLLPTGGTNWWNLSITNARLLTFRWVNSAGTSLSNFANGYTFPLNQWVYVTAVSNNGTMTLYADGISFPGQTTVTARGGTTGILAMCRYNNANNFFQGYINNLRIVNGVAVYTSNFTPPRQNLTAVAGTTLLLNTQYLGYAMSDNSGNNYNMTNTSGIASLTTPLPF